MEVEGDGYCFYSAVMSFGWIRQYGIHLEDSVLPVFSFSLQTLHGKLVL